MDEPGPQKSKLAYIVKVDRGEHARVAADLSHQGRVLLDMIFDGLFVWDRIVGALSRNHVIHLAVYL